MKLDRAIARLRELNEPVPKPPRLPSIEEIEAVQERLRQPLPDDLIQFLLEASDVTLGTLEPVTVTDPSHYTYLPAVAARAWKAGVPRDDFVPVCEDNGDFYCINARGQVVFFSHDGQADDAERWPDLATWIENVWIAESQDEDEDDEDDDDE